MGAHYVNNLEGGKGEEMDLQIYYQKILEAKIADQFALVINNEPRMGAGRTETEVPRRMQQRCGGRAHAAGEREEVKAYKP